MKTFSIRIYVPLLMTLFIILTPLMGLAAGPANSFDSTPPANSFDSSPPANSFNSSQFGKLDNPLKVTNFCDLIKIVLQAILIIGMPIAVIFLVIVGFKFVLAQGKPEAIKEAQKNFRDTIIGIAIFLGAWAIAKIIAATLAGLGVSAVNECIR